MTDWNFLLERLRKLGPVAVAFSGGLDSRFLLHALKKAGVDVLALHATGPHMPASETHYARQWAAGQGIALQEVGVDTLALPQVASNSRERCYHCKKHLLRLLGQAAGARTVCDGTNADDVRAHRPGLRALQEAQVRSPLAEAGLTKARVRELGQATGLENWQQKARPCLLTRLQYGMRVEAQVLRRVEEAEEALLALGLTDFRLRLRPAPLLQTLPLDGEIGARALAVLEEYGFRNAEILQEGSIGGYFDR